MRLTIYLKLIKLLIIKSKNDNELKKLITNEEIYFESITKIRKNQKRRIYLYRHI